MAINAIIKLDKRNITKKGYPIKMFVVGYGRDQFLSLKNKRYSFEENWMDGLLRSHPDYRLLNSELINRESELLKEIDYCNDNNLTFQESLEVFRNGIVDKELKIALLEKQLRELKGDSGTMLFEFWDKFMDELKSEGKSTKAYDDARAQLSNYLIGQDIRINDITYEFLKKFKQYKYQNGCNDGGLATYLRKIKTVFLEAQKRDSLNIKPGNPFKGSIPETLTSENVELSRKEFKKFKKYEPSKFSSEVNKLKMLRKIQLWNFQVLIGGHDFIDLATLEWSNIKNGRIRFRRRKNRSKKGGGPLVDNIILPEALNIIQKYGTKNGKRVFAFIPDPKIETDYADYRKNFNRALRKISQDLEFEHIMKTKSPRYIFRTWAGEERCDFLSTKQVQGQTIPDVSMRYQSSLSNELVANVICKTIYQKKCKPKKKKK